MNLVPKHVAIIMDGNGRWGIKNKGSRILGHKFGIQKIQEVLKYCINKKIKIITLYSFSFDNWKRNREEIKNIFLLFKIFYKKNFSRLRKNKIYLRVIGENLYLPKSILSIKKKINKFKLKNFKIKINVAFNYSSKIEIFKAIKNLKCLKSENVDRFLYTYPDPNPEIIIRTGNRKRLSDFLLWQSSYSEFFFLKKLWPDFDTDDFDKIIKKFSKIKRNFGNAC